MYVISPKTNRQRKITRGDVFECHDTRRAGMRFVVYSVKGSRAYGRNDANIRTGIRLDRLNPHHHWAYLGRSKDLRTALHFSAPLA